MKLLNYGKTMKRGIVSFHCRRQSPRVLNVYGPDRPTKIRLAGDTT